VVKKASWRIVFTNQAQKDAKKITSAKLKEKALAILDTIKTDPFQNPPAYEKLLGDLKGAYSRRINIQRRIVYQVLPKEKIVKVIRMWTHYE
jgi:Txe/YoeB family toxin of toxin-antitoxin system